MDNPPSGPKNDVGETLPGPARSLLRLAKVTQKRGFSSGFLGGFPGKFDGAFPAVSRRLPAGFTNGCPPVFQRFSSGFPAVLPVVSRQSPGGFLGKFNDGLPTVLPVVSRQSPIGFLAISRQHASPRSTPAGSGLPLHPKETVGQFRTHFQAYKPGIAAFSKLCL